MTGVQGLNSPGGSFEYPPGLEMSDQLAFGVGAFVMQWGVCESAFYGLLEVLAGKPEAGVGVVIWFSIRSNRGRAELVERLARAHDISTGLQADITKATERFKSLTKARDFYCHAEYRSGIDGRVSHVAGRRFSTKDDPLNTEIRPLTNGLLRQIAGNVTDAANLGVDALRLILRLQDELRSQHPQLPQELLEALAPR